MRRSRLAYLIAGGLLVGAVLLVMVFAERLTVVSPHYWDAKPSILLGLPPFPPSAEHLLGTDRYGRDIWSRIVFGSRWSLLFAFIIMAARLAVATPASFLAQFGPKRIGWLVDRLYVLTSAIPPLLIYILILAVPQLRVIGLWPSVAVTVSLLTFMEWPRVAVVLKGRLGSLMAEPFIEGAVAVGNTRGQIFSNHLFPHLWPVLLQLVAAEMARALVVIAQLAVFGIMVGGGVINILTNNRGVDTYAVTSGIPEWGTLLGDGRYDVLSHPWIPFSPAVAFLVGVVGFNLLSQGLETVVVSIGQVKAATTARLSRRWRWAWAAVTFAAVFWYYQGLPWGQQQEIRDLADRQATALTSRNVDAFVATLRDEMSGSAADLRRWAADVARDVEAVSIIPKRVQVHGSTATATWDVTVDYAGRPTAQWQRQTRLVRRWGRWYETGEDYRSVAGYHADTWAVFDPVDPRAAGISQRWNVQFLATTADHAYESVTALFPEQAGAPRPVLRLYPDYKSFEMAVGPRLPKGATVWYEPGQPIRVAPEHVKGYKRWDVQRTLAYEMMKFLTATRRGEDRVSPLTLGTWDLRLEEERSTYRIDVDRIAGQKLYTLAELFSSRIEEMSERQFLYSVQSALLVEYAEARLTDRPVSADDLADLAGRLGTSVEQLSRDYHDYVLERIYSESLLTLPAARPRIPAGLPEAIAARAEAVMAGDAARLSAGVYFGDRPGQQTWLEAVRQAGVVRYETSFLDFAQKDEVVTALELERVTFADGREVSGVVRQVWRREGDTWLAGAVSSLIP